MPEETTETPAEPEVPANEKIYVDLKWRDAALKIAVPTALVAYLVAYLVPKLLAYFGI